jgi:hypothetical protein
VAAKKGEKNPVRLPRGAARVQYIACLDEVKKMIGDGVNVTRIYKTLVAAGKITMSQKTFADLVSPPLSRHGKRWRGTKEITACRDEIIAMLDEGHLLAHVHRTLTQQGKITIKYSNFHRILDSLGITRAHIEPLIVTKAANKPPAETLAKDKGEGGS